MAVFKPFCAFRPVQDKAKFVASRPYDVLNTREARIEVDGNPFSFLHIIKPEIVFQRKQVNIQMRFILKVQRYMKNLKMKEF